MVSFFLIFILIGSAFITLFYLDEVLRIIKHKGKKDYFLAAIYDGYCLRNIIIKAYDKDHAVEKITRFKYPHMIMALRLIPEHRLNEVLKVHSLNGGVVI